MIQVVDHATPPDAIVFSDASSSWGVGLFETNTGSNGNGRAPGLISI